MPETKEQNLWYITATASGYQERFRLEGEIVSFPPGYLPSDDDPHSRNPFPQMRKAFCRAHIDRVYIDPGFTHFDEIRIVAFSKMS